MTEQLPAVAVASSRERPVCPVCRTDTAVARVPGFRYGEFRVVRCRRCGPAWVTPFPSASELTNYYAGAYSGPRHDPQRTQVIARELAGLFRAAHPRPRTVLDFGCGEGAVSAALVALGFEVSGVEIAEGDRAVARSRGVDVVAATQTLEPARFDIVFARHVLEHLIDPPLALREMARLIKADGIVIGCVPNFGSRAARWLRGGWEWFAPPAHLWYLDTRGFTALAHAAGLSVERTFSQRGDGTPLLLAGPVAPLRAWRRKRIPPGRWRDGAPTPDPTPARVAGWGFSKYAALVQATKHRLARGDEELWVVLRPTHAG